MGKLGMLSLKACSKFSCKICSSSSSILRFVMLLCLTFCRFLAYPCPRVCSRPRVVAPYSSYINLVSQWPAAEALLLSMGKLLDWLVAGAQATRVAGGYRYLAVTMLGRYDAFILLRPPHFLSHSVLLLLPLLLLLLFFFSFSLPRLLTSISFLICDASLIFLYKVLWRKSQDSDKPDDYESLRSSRTDLTWCLIPPSFLLSFPLLSTCVFLFLLNSVYSLLVSVYSLPLPPYFSCLSSLSMFACIATLGLYIPPPSLSPFTELCCDPLPSATRASSRCLPAKAGERQRLAGPASEQKLRRAGNVLWYSHQVSA